ncbi:hypothetical protein LRM19_12745, partial [Enterobacter sp. PI-10]|uniref:hypothetical protein n=1 Tax=Enterobacter sp. PI-10 TaxID=2899140 RepID=UPI0023016BC3
KKNPVPKGAGFFALCSEKTGVAALAGSTGLVGPIRQSCKLAIQTARSHAKEKQEYKEGIYKRRKAKTQP